jgi:lysophospholipase L1-like esterase
MTTRICSSHDLHDLAGIIQDLPDLFAKPTTRQAGIDQFKKVLERVRAAAPLIPPRLNSLRKAESQRFRSEFSRVFPTAAQSDPQCLLLSDSIALPRINIGVHAHLTYPFLVQATLNKAESRLRIQPDCLRGRTIVDAAQAISIRTNQYTTCPEHLVLQVGIVDCAPRVFLQRDIEIITDCIGKPIAEILIKLASRYRPLVAGDPSTTVYVSINRFNAFLIDILRSLRGHTKIHLITIVTPIKQGVRNDDSALGSNIRAYNVAIRSAAASFNCMLVDADRAIWSSLDPASCFTNDNYHFNAAGHAIVAGEIAHSLEAATNFEP